MSKPTLLHSFYTVRPIFYFTMLPIAQFSAAKVWLWIIIIIIKTKKVWGSGGVWIVIYNPPQNTIKLKKKNDVLQMHTYFIKTTSNRCARLQPGVNYQSICEVKRPSKFHMYNSKFPVAGLGGSIGCAVRLETRRSRVQPPPRSATFFRGDWSWNIFYGHSLPSADSRRAVVSFWRKNVHNTG